MAAALASPARPYRSLFSARSLAAALIYRLLSFGRRHADAGGGGGGGGGPSIAGRRPPTGAAAGPIHFRRRRPTGASPPRQCRPCRSPSGVHPLSDADTGDADRPARPRPPAADRYRRRVEPKTQGSRRRRRRPSTITSQVSQPLTRRGLDATDAVGRAAELSVVLLATTPAGWQWPVSHSSRGADTMTTDSKANGRQRLQGPMNLCRLSARCGQPLLPPTIFDVVRNGHGCSEIDTETTVTMDGPLGILQPALPSRKN